MKFNPVITFENVHGEFEKRNYFSSSIVAATLGD